MDVDLSHNERERLLDTARIHTSKIFSMFRATSCRCSGEYGIKTRFLRSSFKREARSWALTKTTRETAATTRKTNDI